MFTSHRQLFTIPLIIAVLTTVLVFTSRRTIEPIFNETAVIQHVRDLVKQQAPRTIADFYVKNARMIWEDTPETKKERIIQVFYYRPLEIAIGSYIVLLSYYFDRHPLLPIMINCFFLGLVGASIWFLSYVLLKDHFVSIASAIFTVFSMPALIASFQTIGIHALVSLTVTAGVICYLRFKSTCNLWWVAPIVILGFMAPLYKEYSGILIIMLIACEIFAPRRDWRLVVALCVLLVYSISPAFWINLLMYHHGSESSPYASLGVLERILFLDFRFEFIPHYFFALPPVVVLLGLVSTVVNVFDLQQRAVVWRVLGLGLALGLFAAMCIDTNTLGWWGSAVYSVVLVALLSYSAIKIHRVMPVLFVFSWLPCLIVYRNDIYVMYSLAFLAIICFYNIKSFLEKIQKVSRRKSHKLATLIVVMCLLLGAADQFWNLVTLTRVSRAMNQLARHLAHTLADNVRNHPNERPFFVSNVRLAKDVQFFLDKYEQLDIPVNAGYSNVLDPEYADPKKVYPQVLDPFSNARTYLLLNQNKLAQPRAHINVLADQFYDFDIIDQYELRVQYSYLDPFKWFLPERLISFPGNPDLEMYFHKNQELMQREITGRFYIYQNS